MGLKNYYKTLGVTRSASVLDIKKAYRKKVLEYHPDKNPSASSSLHFLLIQEAYQTLSNPIKKEKYDLDYDILYPIAYFEKQKKGASSLLDKFQKALSLCNNQSNTIYINNDIIATLIFCTRISALDLILSANEDKSLEKYIEMVIKSTECRNISTNVEYLEQINALLKKIDNENLYEIPRHVMESISEKIKNAITRKKFSRWKPYLIILISLIIIIIIAYLSKK